MATKIETAAKTTAAKAKTINENKENEMTNTATAATKAEIDQANAATVITDDANTGATAQTATVEPAAPKALPKYLIQREKRQRYSFGNTWLNAVLAGVVSDKDKLVAHGVHVKAGTEAELAALDMEALLKRVQDAIYAEVYVSPADQPQVDPKAEGDTEAETLVKDATAATTEETQPQAEAVTA
ncbi:hypothetical protein [Acinetobacter sp.]|uniref:hypothetical protein n=1 Tax=Acinetobacter sp. TaxID=472 RepID=UPI003890D7F8